VAIRSRFRHVERFLDERARRALAAAEVLAAGNGSISVVSRATGMARGTIRAGLRDIGRATFSEAGDLRKSGRIRRPGAGRKRVDVKDAGLLPALDRLVAPATRGDPESPLRWTSKSTQKLAAALTAQGHSVSARTVARLLRVLRYSLQANRKAREGRPANPDRNAQFEFINEMACKYLAKGQPVISVDTKKKELVGDFRNGGREYQPQGTPEDVQVHDFLSDGQGKAIPYGVYDLGDNSGWVSVGVDHDTAAFAVEAIRRWWTCMGRPMYPEASQLLVTADCGGSNGARVRFWKTELQRLADELRLEITVCHFPPGTSKWNKIEHRLFSHITMNWRGKPLVNYGTIVNLIASTTTRTGLRVRATLDNGRYPKGSKISPRAIAELSLKMIGPHVGWSYVISPRDTK
jgi:hypothetical protein